MVAAWSNRACAPSPSVSRGTVLRATVTPLASILGSGLLIIVPVLETALGRTALFGAVGVSAMAWSAGPLRSAAPGCRRNLVEYCANRMEKAGSYPLARRVSVRRRYVPGAPIGGADDGWL